MSAPMFRIVSNYTELAYCTTLADAKKLALFESGKYDDAVTIDRDGMKVYFAQYGRLYRLTPTR
jgi:hypothetical protein